MIVIHRTDNCVWQISCVSSLCGLCGLCGLGTRCLQLSEMDTLHVGVLISHLGLALFIGAIALTAWRYPLKENSM